MIPKLVKFCKENNNELYLATIIILTAVISFGLGRLSKIREEKMPITIESSEISETIPLSTSNVDSGIKADKIFVASKNKIASGFPLKPKPKKPATNRPLIAKG